MKLKMTIFCLGILVLGFAFMPTQADFIQCPGNAQCDGTANDDVINGTPLGEDILSVAGNDFIFGNDGNDDLEGGDGDDVLFGGLGDDELEGENGNDILMPGPDTDVNSDQYAIGGSDSAAPDGNDIINVFAGDTFGCLYIDGDAGVDIVNLIGFGPYSAIVPFGQTGFGENIVLVIDPITGGQIYIVVNENSEFGTEIINGLLDPQVAIIDFNDLENCNLFVI